VPNSNYNFFEEKDEERKDLRWFPASKEEDCKVKPDFDGEVVRSNNCKLTNK
jgi:hypothetical protein